MAEKKRSLNCVVKLKKLKITKLTIEYDVEAESRVLSGEQVIDADIEIPIS